jgi:aspartyl-tRNA(Asn)/glutamyl-tRNA(Gln) amidotransferase subunit A
MKGRELLDLTAVQALRRIRTGTLKPTELVAKLLERIDRTEPTIKAYVSVCAEQAMRQAQEAERALNRGIRLGPLHGLPVSVKDLIETKGIRTAAGSKILSRYLPRKDATVVSKLKRAGAIVLGKTNTHEFALGGVTPPTSNPWDPSRIPGGSSGGSAAAIAAGSALLSLGTDTGGSIRIPASYCGVTGLKPTYGRVSKSGVFPESWSLDHVGPITKSAEDAALLMSVIAGHDPDDATSSARRVPDYVAELEGRLDGMKIGVPENYFFDLLERGVRSCVNRAIKRLEGLGCRVERINFPMIDEIMGAYTLIDAAEASAYHYDIFVRRAGDYQPDVRALLEAGYFVLAVDYIRALRVRGVAAAEVKRLFKRIDVLVTPTQPNVAPLKGVVKIDVEGQAIDLLDAMVRLCAPFNLLGLPALSIPCGFSGGLPVGLQLIGDYFEEEVILRLAHAYQQETRWHRRHPPL